MKNVNDINCVYDITKFSQLDFPDKLSCILWFVGCNMRCSYCYNPDIVFGKGNIDFNTILKFLNTRKNLLDAVVFSGGECTSHPYILNYAAEVKNNGFLLKIDTNGSNPEMLRKLINDNLVDYVSIDFKALPEMFKQITATNYFEKFEKSLEILVTSNLLFEVRTTIHSDLFDMNDLKNMKQFLLCKGYKEKYYLQLAKTNTKTIEFLPENCFSTLELKEELRGVEIRS